MLTTQNSISQRQLLEERKVAFNQRVSDLGRRWTYVPPKPTLKIVLGHEPFKGKGGSYLSQSLRQGPGPSPPATRCMQASQLLVIFLQTLCSHSLFTRLLKESQGRDPVICQSVFYFFDLQKEPTGQAKYHVIKRFEKCAGAEVSRAQGESETRFSYSEALLK